MAHDQKSGLPHDTSDTLPTSEHAKHAERKNKGPIVIAGVGIAAVAAVVAGYFAMNSKGEAPKSAEPTVSAPVATPSATPEASPSEVAQTIKLPEVSNKGLNIDTLLDAKRIASETDVNLFRPLDALFVATDSGDSSYLDQYHITISEVVLNYQLNALYLDKVKPLIQDGIAEQPADPYPYDLKGTTDAYDYTRGVQFMLGELINQYKDGKQPSLDTKYDGCAFADANDLEYIPLPSGVNGVALIPPLGVSYVTAERFCESNGTETQTVIDTLTQGSDSSVRYANEMGLPAVVKIAQIEADITNLRSAKAKAYFKEFQANQG